MLQKNGKTIIFSADDFGISRWANASILKLAQSGKLDRVEVMVSRNITPEMSSRLLATGVKLDIHFHLAKDKLDYWQNNPRVIEKGAIKRILLFLYNFLFGYNRPKIVAREWEQQIIDFKNLFGRLPDGASSHEHIHFFPPYFKYFLRLCKKYNFDYIRLGKSSFKSRNKVCTILNFLRKMNINRLKKSAVSTSDYMVSFDWNHSIDDCLPETTNSQTEVIFHPELEDESTVLEKL